MHLLKINVDRKVYKDFFPFPAATGLTADFPLPVFKVTLLR
jgi:hypothetical protein